MSIWSSEHLSGGSVEADTGADMVPADSPDYEIDVAASGISEMVRLCGWPKADGSPIPYLPDLFLTPAAVDELIARLTSAAARARRVANPSAQSA